MIIASIELAYCIIFNLKIPLSLFRHDLDIPEYRCCPETNLQNNRDDLTYIPDFLEVHVMAYRISKVDLARDRWTGFRPGIEEALKEDRAQTTAVRISELGLVEMTRKGARQSLARQIFEPCFYCDGTGHLKSRTTLCCDILRELRRRLPIRAR